MPEAPLQLIGPIKAVEQRNGNRLKGRKILPQACTPFWTALPGSAPRRSHRQTLVATFPTFVVFCAGRSPRCAPHV